jgi:hypothetical protein
LMRDHAAQPCREPTKCKGVAIDGVTPRRVTIIGLEHDDLNVTAAKEHLSVREGFAGDIVDRNDRFRSLPDSHARVRPRLARHLPSMRKRGNEHPTGAPFVLKRTMVLSFDDGPGPSTAALLEVQRRATFFMLGCNVQRWYELAVRVAADGHVLGNHGYSHARPGALCALEDLLDAIEHRRSAPWQGDCVECHDTSDSFAQPCIGAAEVGRVASARCSSARRVIAARTRAVSSRRSHASPGSPGHGMNTWTARPPSKT